MAIYKCKMCGGEMSLTGEETGARCPHCGGMQSLPPREPEAAENELRPMDEDALAPPVEETPEEAPVVEVPEEAAPEEAPVEENAEEAAPEEAPVEENAEEAAPEEAPVEENAEEAAPEETPDTDALLKQAVSFLAMSNWTDTLVCCEQVLAVDAENPWAYLCMLMADLNVSRPENLKFQVIPFDNNIYYQKTIAFADEQLRNELVGYIEHINNRNEGARVDNIYTQANTLLQAAETAEDYLEAAELFSRIPDHGDAAALEQTCREKAESIRKDLIFTAGMEKMAEDDPVALAEAAEIFGQIPGWRNADENAAFCRERIDALTAEKALEERKAQLRREKKKQFNRRAGIIRICITAALVLAVLIPLILFLLTPNRKYNKATDLKDEGKYDEAIAIFEELGRYRDSRDQVTECKYLYAVAMKNTGEYEKAIEAFTALEDYKDSKEQIPLCRSAMKERDYNRGIAYMKKGEIVKAYELLKPLGEYKDSAQKTASMYERYKAALMADPQVGGTLIFGKYHTDDDPNTPTEDIEWIILEIKHGNALVISKYAIDARPFHTDHKDITWAQSSLRGWLNTEFLETAFTAEERSRIPIVSVPVDPVENTGTEDPTDPTGATENTEATADNEAFTEDQVFLLSYDEAMTYFASDADRICLETYYIAEINEEEMEEDEEYTLKNRWWWLRTAGFYQSSFMCVSSKGSINDFGIGVSQGKGGVRPVMWITLE